MKKHSFQPGAMSIIQMGEELIGHPSTAINELVKNGYDADATNCKVYINYSNESKKSFALIYDDGSGMDSSILFGDWLKPSVSSKRNTNKISPIYKRQVLGSKGIGRLASMALGHNISVITRMSPNTPYYWLTINRELFKEDILLSKIEFPGDEINDYRKLFLESELLKERHTSPNEELIGFLDNNDLYEFNKGTLIIVEDLDDSVLKILREDFNKNELDSIIDEPLKETSFYKSLSTLITPLKLSSEIEKELINKGIIDKGKKIKNVLNFNLEFGTNLLPEQIENNTDWQKIDAIPIQSIYDYRVYGKVNKDGNVLGYFSNKRLLDQEYEEKLEINITEIIDFKKRKTKNKTLDLFEKEYRQETGEYYFDIRVYDIGEKENLEKLSNQTKFKTGTAFKNAFKSVQGLRISKNGFGVKPYGEEVEDWIGLSKERVQNPTGNVNTNQILGYVYFNSPENDTLEEKTNREGFLENTAFIQVKNTLSVIFKNLGRKRGNFRTIHGIGRVPKSKHDRPRTKDFLDKIKSNDNVSFIRKYSEKFMKEIDTSLDNLEDSLSFSERLASLGSGLELVYHEMAQPISGLRTTKSSLDFKKTKIDPEALKSFVFDINTLDHATNILVDLRKSLQPAIGRTRKKKFKPYDTFLRVCNLYKSDIEEFNININVDDRITDYEISDLEYAFWITFLNIINNAVYWLKKSPNEKKISFFMENENFVIINSGPFINESIIEHIFNYGVTTRQEKNATGLGLAFTQSILSRNNWEIYAENRETGPAFIIKKEEDE
ncbi:sensor histidine kinase [Psychroserpens sp. Hel_I_66]|uniref:ATP-binding protein n=1 Tax=Psychroserpens sp. Hel_I_66 TaxID=1250004 RepID=UPI0006481A7B|nr:sensor histidine kinase [Psychroserpens sp. Hel_I_66]